MVATADRLHPEDGITVRTHADKRCKGVGRYEPLLEVADRDLYRASKAR